MLNTKRMKKYCRP